MIVAGLEFSSCNKTDYIKPRTTIIVKYFGSNVYDDDYNIWFETTTGDWDISTYSAEASASGHKFEHFSVYLPNLKDTGYYLSPSINNISFTDGLDFRPKKLRDGYIQIRHYDSVSVIGTFNVSLEDDFNGAEVQRIEGQFIIYKQ